MPNQRLTLRQLEQRKQEAERQLHAAAIDWALTTITAPPLERAAAKRHLEEAGNRYRLSLDAINVRRIRDEL